jgi:hypothetical protein
MAPDQKKSNSGNFSDMHGHIDPKKRDIGAIDGTMLCHVSPGDCRRSFGTSNHRKANDHVRITSNVKKNATTA